MKFIKEISQGWIEDSQDLILKCKKFMHTLVFRHNHKKMKMKIEDQNDHENLEL
ncbi:hypothetical protein PIB30_109134, partial [Stylosanthes scabra]|nr:hypothetical protein [Stylosanthes scabra]